MGFSASAELENEFSDRFCFWTGLSGKRYIHSVYGADNCPPPDVLIHHRVYCNKPESHWNFRGIAKSVDRRIGDLSELSVRKKQHKVN